MRFSMTFGGPRHAALAVIDTARADRRETGQAAQALAMTAGPARERDPRRNLDGVLLLDKPAGITSNAALRTVQRLYGAAKAGHTGTLDPLATGLLPVCFGEATKFSQVLLDADKTYHAQVTLGVTTTTGDLEGAVTSRAPVAVTLQELARSAVQPFVGEIMQILRLYRAKAGWSAALQAATRRGRTRRAWRADPVKELALMGGAAIPEFELKVVCSREPMCACWPRRSGRGWCCGWFVGSAAHGGRRLTPWQTVR